MFSSFFVSFVFAYFFDHRFLEDVFIFTHFLILKSVFLAVWQYITNFSQLNYKKRQIK